jgi:hypothetical protein
MNGVIFVKSYIKSSSSQVEIIIICIVKCDIYFLKIIVEFLFIVIIS